MRTAKYTAIGSKRPEAQRYGIPPQMAVYVMAVYATDGDAIEQSGRPLCFSLHTGLSRPYNVKNAPGPSGRPVTYHMIIKPIHERRKAIEYGIMIEIKVPRPEYASYFFIKTTIMAK